MLWQKGKSGIFVVIKFIEDMAIRKYAMVAAMALALMSGGLKAQVTSQDVAAAVGQGVVDFLEGRGTWIPDRPGYFNSGGLVYKNVSTSMVRQLSEAIVWRIDVQPEGVLHIPDDINVGFDRFHVSGFAEGAFEYGHMTAIDLPHREIRSIPRRCFSGCSNLQSVTFHSNKTKFIEAAAFRWCSSLKSLRLPSSVKHIGDFAFDQSGLVEFVIPKSVESLGERAFHNCKSLKKVVIPGHRLGVISGYCFSGCESLEEITLPAGVHSILSYAFENSGIKHITWSNNMKAIYSFAFKGTQIQRIDSHATTPPQTGQIFTLNDAKRIELHVPRGCEAAYRNAPVWEAFVNIIADL